MRVRKGKGKRIEKKLRGHILLPLQLIGVMLNHQNIFKISVIVFKTENKQFIIFLI